ncbi:MAG: hypothetical protein WBD15_23035, partial [Pseudolabrys sp.]
RTLVSAYETLVCRGQSLRLLIAGEPDPANPASIPAEEIAAWARRPSIEVLGHVEDIREVWRRALLRRTLSPTLAPRFKH